MVFRKIDKGNNCDYDYGTHKCNLPAVSTAGKLFVCREHLPDAMLAKGCIFYNSNGKELYSAVDYLRVIDGKSVRRQLDFI